MTQTITRRRQLAAAMAMMANAEADVDAPPAVTSRPVAVASPVAVRNADGRTGPLSGQTWAGYEVGDLLGSGGMGEVYRARQLSVGRLVALKILAQGVVDPSRRERFAAEARAAARVRSPHVVAIYDSGACDGQLWLAMELVEGGTLADRLRRQAQAGGAFAVSEAIALVQQAARGLAEAHRERLVHRDIKPANLLLGTDGVLRIADFGLVRILDEQSLTVTGTVVGTPQYLAPEQGRGITTDARGDIYSLGVVLYELLTMRLPFTGSTAEELVSQHNFTEPALPSTLVPDLPVAVDAVCMTCLQKDPGRRYRDAGALADDLERIAHGLAPISVIRTAGRLDTGASEAIGRLAGGRRRQWLIAAGLLAATGLLVAGGWWWQDARKTTSAVLRARLAQVLTVAPVPPTAAADLARLTGLAGADDPLVAAGRGKLAAIAQAETMLGALARETAPDQAAIAAGESALAGLIAAVGPEGHPQLGAWRTMLRDAAARLELARSRLAPRLRDLDLAGDPLRSELAADLAVFLHLAASDDPDRNRWSDLLARSDAAKAADLALLSRLDRPEPVLATELAGLRTAQQRLARLAPTNPMLGRWSERLAAEAGDLDEHRRTLTRILDRQALSQSDRLALTAAMQRLDARGALDPIEGGVARARISEADAELADLRLRLAVLDAPRSLPDGIADNLKRYEALAGFQDPRGIAWRQRYEAIRAISDRLAILDRAAPPPAHAAEDLTTLAGLVGSSDPAVQRWTQALARQTGLRTRLAILDTIGSEPPAWAAEELADLRRLAGEADPDLRRWAGVLAGWARLAATVQRWQEGVVLPARELAEARRDLAGWKTSFGDGALLRAAAARLDELAGPAPPSWATGHGHDAHGPWIDLAVGAVHQRLRWLPPVTGRIGSGPGETDAEADETPAQVRLSAGLWIADRECTQQLWSAVMGTSPSAGGDPLGPVEQVSHADAIRFCERLTEQVAGCHARLPDENEWELAARAGQAGPWAGLAAADAAGAIRCASGGPAPAGSHPANALGLHDLLGNVWEWCSGGYGQRSASGMVTSDPGDGRGVVRGGSWADPLGKCRAANRSPADPAIRSPLVGFRFVIRP